MKIAFIVEYDGTAYGGWQVQKNRETVQQKLEEALETLGKGHITVYGAGRTDAGVHARGQCGHFVIDAAIPSEKYAFILNTRLPRDIRVTRSWQAADGFHCRYDAKGKRYIYRIWNAPHSSPLHDRFTMFVPEKLDLDKMRAAAKEILGTHDFAAFCAAGSSAKTTVRTVTRLDVSREGSLIEITVEGTGFLYNMVRIIAGTLIAAGKGKMTALDVADAIAGKTRSDAGMTAEARGLTMDEVFY